MMWASVLRPQGGARSGVVASRNLRFALAFNLHCGVAASAHTLKNQASAQWSHNRSLLCVDALFSSHQKGSTMQYRRLGRCGLQVSALSLGSWVTYHNQVDTPNAREMMAAAMDAGVNFFDNAEVYAGGQSEVIMGQALRELKWPRLNYIVSSKFYWGISGDDVAINRRNTLNRKYLLQALDGSLQRLGLDFVDLAYCHRPDPHTPIEETVWAMHNMITQGKALYWGTSEWSAAEIRAAWDVADKHHLHKPVVEQPQYHLFHRRRVEHEYGRLYDDIGLGLTTWSPLASGLLTGKYKNGIPPGSRGAMENMSFLRDGLVDAQKNAAVAELEKIAAELNVGMAQLAIAWVLRNPRVSSVITGASKLSQLQSNLHALKVLALLTPEALQRIDQITAPLSA
jgi:voltage-dependent potassium channel beta subunit